MELQGGPGSVRRYVVSAFANRGDSFTSQYGYYRRGCRCSREGWELKPLLHSPNIPSWRSLMHFQILISECRINLVVFSLLTLLDAAFFAVTLFNSKNTSHCFFSSCSSFVQAILPIQSHQQHCPQCRATLTHVVFPGTGLKNSPSRHQASLAGPHTSPLPVPSTTLSENVSLSEHKPHHYDQGVLSLCTENVINMVNSASRLPFLSSPSLPDPKFLTHLQHLILCISSIFPILNQRRVNELISPLTHPAFFKFSIQKAICTM